MTTRTEPEHSPKGGSSAERWMNCPGSGVLLAQLSLPETDEPEYRALGTAAHEAGHHCLVSGVDTWEIVGQQFNGFTVGHGKDAEGREMIDPDHLQTYLDDVRQFMTPGVTVYIEAPLGEDPDTRPHPDFYGRLDFGAYGPEVLVIEDLKWGEGIVVEPFWNAQLLYYAYGLIEKRRLAGAAIRSDRPVLLRICQPRAFHVEGPIREWSTTAGEIIAWAEDKLIPAMKRAEIDTELNIGKHCRFCPAKLVCPLLTALFGAAAKADPMLVPEYGNDRLGLEYQQLEALRFYVKALEDEVYRRNMHGDTVPGSKLVAKRSFRVFKEGAASALEVLGAERFTKPELKSPAEIEKLGPGAKKLVAQWAYMPQNGFTIAPEDDTRTAVKVEKAATAFAHFAAAVEQTKQENTNV